jgi:hypothetical protein
MRTPQPKLFLSVFSNMRVVIPFALLLLALAGCRMNLEKQVVGTWKADTAKTVLSGEKLKSDDDRKMAMALIETIELNIKEDKTFEMKVIFPVHGTWAIQNNHLILTPVLSKGESFSFAGKDTMDFTVGSEGKTMSAQIDNKDMGGTLVMAKAAS